ncbi:helix-turn-helix transcriptional regulator [Candidatus Poriferisodalis sp.]|uniref:helix-turn-helix transcriptional regulator n=1 Tax=Candidatus Poriferisodalis sp. TaxID=3101277 RepID=UPI003AF61498
MPGERDVLTPEALGLALRDARRAAGLSQSEAAERAQTTRATISAAERGQGGLLVAAGHATPL